MRMGPGITLFQKGKSLRIGFKGSAHLRLWNPKRKMPGQGRHALSAEEELAKSFQAGLLTWLAGMMTNNPECDAAFSRHNRRNGIPRQHSNEPHSGGDHAGFAPASLFSS